MPDIALISWVYKKSVESRETDINQEFLLKAVVITSKKSCTRHEIKNIYV